ncbi:MAG: dTDP-6-deoxy-L-hexose 3-O-methyltransferase [Magnetococcales bacterium]|nr:dTDP-6-deoxy-L-hexose 3-O-methyltransferase [Magnetococcales bacterium]
MSSSENKQFGYTLETKANESQIAQRDKIRQMFEQRPMPDEHLLVSMGLYMRSSALVKILFINELYELILNVPGVIVEFGVWWGQNLVLAENLRAIHEPFDQTRRVIGFDTFKGYAGFSDQDKPSQESGFKSFTDVVKTGGYSVSEGYRHYLDELISAHEGTNVLGKLRRHTLIEGDVTETAPRYFKENPGTIVALAYFDLALYQPTKACLEAILPCLVPGSVVLLDELNYAEAPGETVAFKEVFANVDYSIRKSKYIKDKSIVIINKV